MLERIVSGRTKSHQLHELVPWAWKAARTAGAAAGRGMTRRPAKQRRPRPHRAWSADRCRSTNSSAGCACRRPLRPVADSLTMLDGDVTAIVAGPVTYEPLGWLCPLLGVTKQADLDGDTPEFAAIAAVAEHHNALAATLSEKPNQFTPRFGRSETGAVDVGPWCRGFYAAIQLNPKYWRKLLPRADRPTRG